MKTDGERTGSGEGGGGSGAAPATPPEGALAPPARVRPPSLGFLWLAAVAAAVAAFLAWGLREPDLDRAARILRGLELGKAAPRPADLRFLSRTLERHPGLRRALLGGRPAALLTPHRGGWIETERAVLIADPAADPDPRIALSWSSCMRSPHRISFSGRGGSETIAVSGVQGVSMHLSPSIRAGGVLEVRVEEGEAPGGLADGFRIVVEGAAAPAAGEAEEER